MREAKLILYHGIEPWFKRLVDASGTIAPQVKIAGPWNTPVKLKERYEGVADALRTYLNLDLDDKLARCLKIIDDVGLTLFRKADELGFKEVKVICMRWQKPFVEWLGFKVIADYLPPEKLSPADVAALIEKSREERPALIIDNLQSGIGLGEYLAKELGAVHVVLTNFPYTERALVNMTEVMKHNAKELSSSYHVYKYGVEIVKLQTSLTFWTNVATALTIVVIAEAIGLTLLWRRKEA